MISGNKTQKNRPAQDVTTTLDLFLLINCEKTMEI